MNFQQKVEFDIKFNKLENKSHQIGHISTKFSCNFINFQEENGFDIKFNMVQMSELV
jgi:hypothetical protein